MRSRIFAQRLDTFFSFFHVLSCSSKSGPIKRILSPLERRWYLFGDVRRLLTFSDMSDLSASKELFSDVRRSSTISDLSDALQELFSDVRCGLTLSGLSDPSKEPSIEASI